MVEVCSQDFERLTPLNHCNDWPQV